MLFEDMHVNIFVFAFSADDLLLPWETEAGTPLRFPVPCTQMAVCDIGNEVRFLAKF